MLNNFEKKIIFRLRKIPKGKISTYKILAEYFKVSPRLIGKVLSKNPYPKKFPCYKIIKSNGEIGEYNCGARNKIALLKKDGLIIKNNKILNFEKCLFKSF